MYTIGENVELFAKQMNIPLAVLTGCFTFVRLLNYRIYRSLSCLIEGVYG